MLRKQRVPYTTRKGEPSLYLKIALLVISYSYYLANNRQIKFTKFLYAYSCFCKLLRFLLNFSKEIVIMYKQMFVVSIFLGIGGMNE